MTEAEATGLYLSGLKPTVMVLLKQGDVLGRQQAQIKDLERHLALARNHPSTPSGMKAPYAKAAPKAPKRKKNRKFHRGGHRPPPDKIDPIVQDHTLERCPDCNNPLPDSSTTRERFTEELPVLKPQVVQHIIHRYWCCLCKKIVDAPVTDALPKSTIGLRTMVYSAWLHYILGVSFDKVIELLNVSAYFKISTGGLFGAWRNLAQILQPLYEQVGHNARWSAVLHADETGWRVNGRLHWLWCFTSKDLAYYVIDRCRGSPVVLKVLGKFFAGILVTDFFAAYNQIIALAKQKCLVHLLRELVRVDLFDFSPQWKYFRRQLKRFIIDAIRLGRKRTELKPTHFEARKKLLRQRLTQICFTSYPNENAERLRKRLQRHQDEILTFLDHPDMTADNNHAERQIRPAVVSRKISYGNRSQQGADVQAMLLSIFRTLELRGYSSVNTVIFLVKEHLRTGKRISLPPPLAAPRFTRGGCAQPATALVLTRSAERSENIHCR